ncbi:MAG: tRNA (N6-isopentenyl adenosine(37)-C2)-methylthiotransferase MiaB [Oscillospiraceae bacterium]|nr:tRNA (N6-isopentenyl adenosine(37)-C2)-methylthiotransferase MiaB [Oscillospiraceae bacterium]
MADTETKEIKQQPDASVFCSQLKQRILETGGIRRCYIRTFGCQQNVSDSERMAGLLEQCGYETTDSSRDADLIVFNTCAVREHAEFRVFGNVGALKKQKEENPSLIIAVGGCMVEQPQIAKKMHEMFPFVDIIFNTNELQRLPEHILRRLDEGRSVLANDCSDYSICEAVPVKRDGDCRAFVPVMYGCDNFCTYCIVPFVRGRERSRASGDVIAECRRVVDAGYKEIMLLGQNVNSYGRKLEEEINFSELLRRVNAIEGDFKIRFMTSHPKDATHELFDTIAACEKVSRHIHLPVQSGSDGILKKMNRRYTAQEYLSLIEYARKTIPGVTFSSDIIVGFPGETATDFKATEALVESVGYRSLFTFIFSPRAGTAAAKMTDAASRDTKSRRIAELIELQDAITARQDAALVGTTHTALVTEALDDDLFEARLDDNSAVTLSGPLEVGSYAKIEITRADKKRLFGKAITE